MNETWEVERYEQKPRGYSLPDRFRVIEDDDQCICGDVRQQENADMISAVPDMLNALMVVAINTHTMGYEHGGDPKLLEQIKNALEKAGWGPKLNSALNWDHTVPDTWDNKVL